MRASRRRRQTRQFITVLCVSRRVADIVGRTPPRLIAMIAVWITANGSERKCVKWPALVPHHPLGRGYDRQQWGDYALPPFGPSLFHVSGKAGCRYRKGPVMQKKQEYLARAEAEVKRAKQRLPHYAGECSSCRWSRSGVFADACEHPAVVCAAFNIADSYARRRVQECDEQRDDHSLWGPIMCGPDGALFEQKEPWWSRIFGRTERTGA